ncbi:hypothetical protein C8Q79DRAFT_213683 [Trametes meyenii]|nr:hypothetical protein C8Q79DRAFT_213683 [Trametes meyenii]
MEKPRGSGTLAGCGHLRGVAAVDCQAAVRTVLWRARLRLSPLSWHMHRLHKGLPLRKHTQQHYLCLPCARRRCLACGLHRGLLVHVANFALLRDCHTPLGCASSRRARTRWRCSSGASSRSYDGGTGRRARPCTATPLRRIAGVAGSAKRTSIRCPLNVYCG